MDEAGVVHQQVPDELYDHVLWLSVNPAVAAGRGQGLPFLEEEWHRLGPEAFGREHLGIWAPEEGSLDAGPIERRRWDELVDGESMATDESLTLGLDASVGRGSACFVVAGKRSDGLRHGAIRYWLPRGELGRLVDVGVTLAAGHGVAVHVPPKSPALAWRSGLENAGVEVVEVSGSALLEAQQVIEQAVAEGTFRHRGQPEMGAAVMGLAARQSGDSSPWSRRSSAVDVSPLFALAAAVAGGVSGDGRSVYEDSPLMVV